MTPFDVALARLLLAAAGSLAAGCAVWAVAVLCLARMPALAGQRSLWLLGQVAVAAVFVAMLLPHSERLSVAPVIVMGEGASSPAASASAPLAAGAATRTPAPAPTPAPRGAVPGWPTPRAPGWRCTCSASATRFTVSGAPGACSMRWSPAATRSPRRMATPAWRRARTRRCRP